MSSPVYCSHYDVYRFATIRGNRHHYMKSRRPLIVESVPFLVPERSAREMGPRAAVIFPLLLSPGDISHELLGCRVKR